MRKAISRFAVFFLLTLNGLEGAWEVHTQDIKFQKEVFEVIHRS